LQMLIEKDQRSQFVLGMVSWAVVISLYLGNKWFINRRPVAAETVATVKPNRVLVLANETADSTELLDELRRIGADGAASYYVVVPASSIETGVAATHGPYDVMEATEREARDRLERTLSTLRRHDLEADGALGNYRPLRALADAVDTFHPDQIVIATLPPENSVWHRFEVVDRARSEYSNIPVIHVVSTPVAAEQIVP